MKIRFFTLILLMGLIGFSAPPAQAKNILQILFPELFDPDLGPKPEETLQAPFSYESADRAAGPLAPKADTSRNTLALDIAHRLTQEVGEWVMVSVSETMTFSDGDFNQDLAMTKPYFDEEGRKQYIKFLQEKGLAKILQTKQHAIRSFAREEALLMNEGPVGGRYRWLFQIPMMVSFMDLGVKDYKKVKEAIPNQGILITVEVARAEGAPGEHGILIERWNAKMQKLDKR